MEEKGGLKWIVKYFEKMVIYEEKIENIVGDMEKYLEIRKEKLKYKLKMENEKWNEGEKFK